MNTIMNVNRLIQIAKRMTKIKAIQRKVGREIVNEISQFHFFIYLKSGITNEMSFTKRRIGSSFVTIKI